MKPKVQEKKNTTQEDNPKRITNYENICVKDIIPKTYKKSLPKRIIPEGFKKYQNK